MPTSNGHDSAGRHGGAAAGTAQNVVGPPPAVLPRGGTGQWLVSLGYWTDLAASVLSEIASFTYAHCNDPPDRFAQTVHDARSAIGEIAYQLPLDATTTTTDGRHHAGELGRIPLERGGPTTCRSRWKPAAWAMPCWRRTIR